VTISESRSFARRVEEATGGAVGDADAEGAVAGEQEGMRPEVELVFAEGAGDEDAFGLGFGRCGYRGGAGAADVGAAGGAGDGVGSPNGTRMVRNPPSQPSPLFTG